MSDLLPLPETIPVKHEPTIAAWLQLKGNPDAGNDGDAEDQVRSAVAGRG